MVEKIAESNANVDPTASGAVTVVVGPSVQPSYRPDDIHFIVETVDRYNPQNIPLLEDYVTQQMKSNEYDRTACLALLKLYQFNPSESNPMVIASILALALAALPDSDFNLCLYMLREDTLTDPIVSHFMNMQQLLEQAKFAEFWQYLENNESIRETVTSDYPLFEENIREFIADTLAITYQTISIERLEGLLDLTGEDLVAWVHTKEGWEVHPSDETLLNLPSNSFNQAKSLQVQEDVKFSQLSKVLAQSRLFV